SRSSAIAPTRHRRARVIAASLAVVALLVGACGSSKKQGAGATSTSSTAAAAPGETRYHHDGYSFSYPTEWHVQGASERITKNVDVEIKGPTGASGAPAIITALSATHANIA